MNMAWIDWIVVAGFYGAVISIGLYCKKFARGVTDFLVAGRGMGKYLGFATGEAADTGVISIVASMEMMYRGGPALLVYTWITLAWGLFIGKTGFVIKRYRETRILTQPQLYEARYSKGVRIFAAIICVLSGLINMGIFPIVAARFFVYFGGLPTELAFLGMHLNTIHVLTGFLIAASIAFALMGGQVSVVVTDFIQAVLMSIIFVIMGIVIYRLVAWQSVTTAYLSSDKVNMFLNPFSKEGEFGLKYLFLALVMKAFSTAAWAPSMQKISSAKSPRDARLMMLLYNLRMTAGAGRNYAGLAVFALLSLPLFAHFGLAEAMGGIEGSVEIQKQMAAPLMLAKILPIGAMGLMFAGMLAADISTNDTYMLTWAGIIVQDIIYPLKKKKLSRKHHMILLRISVIFVGLFIFFFGIFYKPTEAIVIFQLLSGTIYIAGAGTIITLGLYWRRGNKYGAYAAISVGATFPILNHIFKLIGGIEGATATYVGALVVYVVVSLLTPDPHYDLEKLLNRPPKTRKVE